MITPLELLNKEFSVKMRGYDRAEVDEFLNLLQKDYETLFRYYRKNCGSDAIEQPKPEDLEPVTAMTPTTATSSATSETIVFKAAPEAGAPERKAGDEGFAEPVVQARQEAELSETLKGILALAQRVSEDARRAAEAQAAAIISEAEAEAARLAASTEDKLSAAERRLADLSSQESALRARMKGYLEVYRQLIDDFEATSGIDYSL